MEFRILLLFLLPLLSFAQSNSKVTIPINNQTNDKESIELKRNALYNIEEIKVRWKKAALENCPGVPCPTFSVPGPCRSIAATPTIPYSVTVSFLVPTSDGGSPITGYIVTATPTASASAKRKSSSVITATGSSSPMLVTGLTFSVNYIFSLVATNAVGSSSPVTTTATVTHCTLNTAGTASSSPTLLVNTTMTNITIATTGATGIGTATGLPAGVTASWSADVITISGTPTTTGTFNYTIPLTGGCGSVNATGSITVSACPTATITDNGMNTYNTVTIGTQCWMKENLRVRRYNDSTEIRFDKSVGTGDLSGQTWAGSGRKYGAYTIYAHDSTATPSNLTSYGYLYNWYAAKGIASTGSTTYKNICLSGWHVPTDSDWNKLVKFIDPGADTSSTSSIQSSTAGVELKSNSSLWSSNTGTNNYYFSALPGGFRSNPGEFSSIRNTASFWSATENNTTTAWSRGLGHNNGNVSRISSIFAVGASVRCLRD
jgi:uncharacterized protein (TIGR02145 family)